jgi:hypothetical protein
MMIELWPNKSLRPTPGSVGRFRCAVHVPWRGVAELGALGGMTHGLHCDRFS